MIGSTETGIGASVAGLVIFPTPATPAGIAVVAEADQFASAAGEPALRRNDEP